jgi:hypothetical protein
VIASWFSFHESDKGTDMLLVIELTHHRAKIFRLEFGAVVILLGLLILLAGSMFGYFFGGVIGSLPTII